MQKEMFNQQLTEEKDLETCVRLGINPNKNYPGSLPPIPEEDVEKWAAMPLEVALKISVDE